VIYFNFKPSMGGTVARNNGAIPGAAPVKDGKSNRGQPICGLRHGQTGGSAGVKSWTPSGCFVTFTLAADHPGAALLMVAEQLPSPEIGGVTLNPPPTP
jgi:hypothetical protein